MVQDRDHEVQLFNKNILLKPGATIEGAITNFGWMLKCYQCYKIGNRESNYFRKIFHQIQRPWWGFPSSEINRQKLIVENC